jgi:hypothetical protein
MDKILKLEIDKYNLKYQVSVLQQQLNQSQKFFNVNADNNKPVDLNDSALNALYAPYALTGRGVYAPSSYQLFKQNHLNAKLRRKVIFRRRTGRMSLYPKRRI